MKFFMTVLTITSAVFFLFSFQTYGKMNSLSNESLSSVEGDPGINGKNLPSTSTEETDPAMGTEMPEGKKTETKLSSLINSDEYKKFLFFLQQLGLVGDHLKPSTSSLFSSSIVST